MMNLGDFPVGATVHFKWATYSGIGASVNRSTDGSILIYKNGSTAQRSSASGITDTEAFDSVTGVHHLSIDLSDNTDAGFYSAGDFYQVVLSAATIDGQVVNQVLAHFSIERVGGFATILSRLPAALVSGRMDSSVGAMAANTLTATAIQNDAITAAKIADGAIDAATFAANAIARAALAPDTGLKSIRSSTAQAGAAGTITLDASASSVTDFYKGMLIVLAANTGSPNVRLCTAYNGTTKVATVTPNWPTAPDNTTTFTILPIGPATVEAWLGAVAPAMTGDAFARLGAPAGATVSADVAVVSAKLPALVSGRVDASVGAYQSGQAPLQPTTAGRTLDVSSTGEAGLDFDNIKQATGATTLTNITIPVVTSVTNGVTLAAAALAAIWDRLTSALTTSGSIGKLLVDTLDAAVSTRAAPGAAMTLTAGERTAVANEVEAQIIDESDSEKVLTAITDKIASVNPDLGSLTVAAIASAAATSVWSKLTSALTDVGSVGKLLVDRIDATVSSRSSHAAADIWAVGTRRLSDGLNIVLAKGVGVTGFNDISALQVSTEITDALDDAALATAAELAAVRERTDNLPDAPADQVTLLALDGKVVVIDDLLDTEVGAIKTVTDQLPNGGALTSITGALSNIQGRIPAALILGRMDSSVGAMQTNVLTAAATAADFSTEIGAGIPAALLAAEIEDGITLLEHYRYEAAVLYGPATGLLASAEFSDPSDTVVRVAATLSAGTRSAVTLDASDP